jgi:hypothetical protein
VVTVAQVDNSTSTFHHTVATSLKMNLSETKEIIETPFNKDFCAELKIRIYRELENTKDTELKGFWCDGIFWLDKLFPLFVRSFTRAKERT